jgi:hypothetical protein
MFRVQAWIVVGTAVFAAVTASIARAIGATPLEALWITVGLGLTFLVGFEFGVWLRRRQKALEDRVAVLEAQREAPRASPAIPTIPSPDFTQEIKQAYQMLEAKTLTDRIVDSWIEHVFSRLLPWNPAMARQFRPPNPPETEESMKRRAEWKPSGIASLQSMALNKAVQGQTPPSPEYPPEHTRLRTYLERLLKIVSPAVQVGA